MSDPAPLERVEEDEATLRGADPLYASPDYRSTRLRAPGRPLLVLPARARRHERAGLRRTAASARTSTISPGSTPASRSASASSCTAAWSTATTGRYATR